MANQENLARFRDALRVYNADQESNNPLHYPFNVLYTEDRRKLLEAYFRHHTKVRGKILLQLGLLSRPISDITDAKTWTKYEGIRRRASDFNVPIHDYGPDNQHTITFRRLRECLENLHFPVPQSLVEVALNLVKKPPRKKSTANGVDPSPPRPNVVEMPNFERDPMCRFVLFETEWSDSHTLNITEDMLFLILSFHQVSPAYLNFITCFSSQTGSSDLRFGGFRSQAAFRHADDRGIKELARSGINYQLCLKLRTVLERDPNVKDKPGRVSGPSKLQAAIYHHFDVREARAFWIVTAPKRSFENSAKANVLWDQIRLSISECRTADGRTVKVASGAERHRFAGSLGIFVTVAEWSLSDFAFYIQHIEEQLDGLTDQYLEDRNIPEVDESTLQKINYQIQELNHCVLNLESNVSVLKNLIAFYSSLLSNTRHLAECAWLQTCVSEVAEFRKQVRAMVGETQEIMARANVLRQLARNREDFIQKLLQNRTTNRINFLTGLGFNETMVMRVFQTITLVLLPMTVISTLFSTDIVKFQNIGDRLFHFSWMALVWFVVAMAISSGSIWLWFRYTKAQARREFEEQLYRALRGETTIDGGEDGVADVVTTMSGGNGQSPGTSFRSWLGGLLSNTRLSNSQSGNDHVHEMSEVTGRAPLPSD